MTIEVARVAAVLAAAGCLGAAFRGPLGWGTSDRSSATTATARALAATSWWLGGQTERSRVLRRPTDDRGAAQRVLVASPGAVARCTGALTAGSPIEVGRRLAGARTAAVLCGLMSAVALIAVIGPLAAPPAFVLALIMGGSVDGQLALTARRARAEVEAGLPVVIELLAGMLTAGVPLGSALAHCAAMSSPPFRRILDRLAVRVSTGASAAHALQIEAATTGVPGLAMVAATVERAAATGAPVSDGLSRLAAELAAQLHHSHQRRAGRNGPYASLLTALVIAPACVGVLLTLVVGGFVLGGSGQSP